jgi:FkbM family methyltransferase
MAFIVSFCLLGFFIGFHSDSIESAVGNMSIKRIKSALSSSVQSAAGPLSGSVVQNLSICLNTCGKARNGICDDGRQPISEKIHPELEFYRNYAPWNATGGAEARAKLSPQSYRVHCELGTDCDDCGPWITSTTPPWDQSGSKKGPVSLLLDREMDILVRLELYRRFRFAYTDPKKDTAVSSEMEFYAQIETGASKIFSAIFNDRCIRPDGSRSLFVDVGANFGWFSILAASMGCRVLAFEPVPHFRAFFEYNVHLNGLGKLIDIRSNVVSSKSGVNTAMVFPKKGIWGTASVDGINADEKQPKDSYEVDTSSISVTLDGAVKEDVLLMKVDVEGWEWSVMMGAAGLLSKFNVENIIMEYSPGVHEMRQNHSERFSTIQMLVDIAKSGYRIAHIGDGDGPRGTVFHNPELPQFEEIKADNLAYDLEDARRYEAKMMGCPVDPELQKLAHWERCMSVPEDLNPRSFRSIFGHNTNVWASKNSSLMRLKGTVGMMPLDAPKGTYFLQNKYKDIVYPMGMGMRDCSPPNIQPRYQVRHRCKCTDKVSQG